MGPEAIETGEKRLRSPVVTRATALVCGISQVAQDLPKRAIKFQADSCALEWSNERVENVLGGQGRVSRLGGFPAWSSI
jgi:hypothetical protein